MEQKRFEVIFSPSAQKDVEKLEVDKALQLATDIKIYYRIPPKEVIILAITHKKNREKFHKKFR